MKIGLFLCNCKNLVEIKYKDIKGIEGIDVVELSENLCSEDGKNTVKKDIERNDLDHVIIGCPYPKDDYKTELELEPNKIHFLDVRDLTLIPHGEKSHKTTKKLVRAYKKKLELTEPDEEVDVELGDRLIFYATSSSDVVLAELLSDLFEVKLVIGKDVDEKIIESRLDVYKGQINKINGDLGDFRVEINQNRNIDFNKCNDCGKCKIICPQNAISDNLFIGDECDDCVKCLESCPTNAITLEDKKVTLRADQVVVGEKTEYETKDQFGIYDLDKQNAYKVIKEALSKRNGYSTLNKLDIKRDKCAAIGMGDLEGCSLCIDECPENAISISSENKIEFNLLECNYCGLCQSLCPLSVVEVKGSNNEIVLSQVDEVLKDNTGFFGSSLKKNVVIFSSPDYYEELISLGKETRDLPPVIPLKTSSKAITNSMVLGSILKGIDKVIVAGEVSNRLLLSKKILEKLDLEEHLKIIDKQNKDNLREKLWDIYNSAPKNSLKNTSKEIKSFENRSSFINFSQKLSKETGTDLGEFEEIEQPFAVISIDDGCTLCGACVNVCPTEALRKYKKEISFKHEDCINCGLCEKACPEDCLEIEQKLDFNDLKEKEIWKAEMIRCKNCGKPFMSKSAFKRVKDKLNGKKGVFQENERLEVMKYCEECKSKVALEKILGDKK
ncbi:MAG: F420-reducing hydrogenase delta subunit polyferredoxin [Candidatus Methanohalarchaeum thermophilum]|uniref:F420-reducing hydrogenase delta subunit polyferredoxin n=1 Tax=Methanohalarchaeum thermophilum TaxID=1903181 RepID=A0A1Q6DWF7_METT1|nr:MAG: F420-reducing hydrogenase delta subunit polyferredoxin [Candidatus Methanohalarchaeum thermophilum]